MTSTSGSRNPLPRVTVRSARLDDAEATREIYNAEVTTSTVTFDLVPRSLEEQREWLTARSGAHAVLVAEDKADGVVGFASLSPWGKRPAYATSVEDSVYVHRDHRGRGIGRALLAELLEVATAHGFHAVFARIVGHHEASARLHLAAGFEIVGTEREVGRKFGRWLDVVVMELLLTPGGAARNARPEIGEPSGVDGKDAGRRRSRSCGEDEDAASGVGGRRFPAPCCEPPH